MIKRKGRYVRSIASSNTGLYALSGENIWNARTSEPVLLNHGNIAEFAVLGAKVVFMSEVGGNYDLFVLDREHSEQPIRATVWATKRSSCMIAGYASNQNTNILLSSTHEHASRLVYDLNLDTKLASACKFGFEVQRISIGPTHTVIQRRGYGYHGSWQGYTGGAAGQLWSAQHNAPFAPLLTRETAPQFVEYNALDPVQYNNRVYFLSDALGWGNVHSCELSGRDVRQETHCTKFYVKSFTFYEDKLYYVAGGQIYSQSLGSERAVHCPLDIPHSSNHRIALASHYADSCRSLDINQSHEIALVSRGNLHKLAPMSNAAYDQHNFETVAWLGKHDLLATATDKQTCLYKIDKANCITSLAIPDIGIITEIAASPEGKMACLATNRHELHLYTIDTAQTECIATNSNHHIWGVRWSHDSRYVLYASGTRHTSVVHIFDTQTKLARNITPIQDSCSNPVFDTTGKYVAFIHKQLDSTHNPYNRKCTQSIKIATLDPKISSPLTGLGSFVEYVELEASATAKPVESATAEKVLETADAKTEPAAESTHKTAEAEKSGEQKLELDLGELAANLFNRTESWQLPEDKCVVLLAMTDKGVIWAEAKQPDEDNEPVWSIVLQEWQEPKPTTLIEDVTCFACGEWAAYLTVEGKLITAKLGEKPPASGDARKDTPGTWRLPYTRVNPPQEWQAILMQAWRLMKEHFHNGKPVSIDWDALYTKYSALIPDISSRSELNAVICEMQSELRTSHSYIYIPGDVTYSRRTTLPGDLRAQIEWDGTHWVYRRSYSNADETPPLGRFALAPGTIITHIDNCLLTLDCPPGHALLGKANTNVQVRTCDPMDPSQIRTLQTRSLPHNPLVQYYQWRADTASHVPSCIGYVHIPNMMRLGFKEFWRQYIKAYDKQGLIVDARNNGGGNASSAILQILLGRRIGEHVPKYHHRSCYVEYAPRGPIVVLINGWCGSDGDVFAQAYKDLRGYEPSNSNRFGPLIGERTWGGVVGIWPRYAFTDGGMITQPEFAIRFDSLDFGLENRGVAPDIEVVNTPDREASGIDDQLDRAIKEVQILVDLEPK